MQADETKKSTSPNSNYDFILNDGQKPKRALPGLPANLPKPALILIALGGVTILLFLIFTIFSGGGTPGADAMVEVLGKSKEISRVNALEKDQLKGDSLALLSTTESSLSSDQAQTIKWLRTKKIKVDTKKLVVYKHPDIDSKLATAAQNNTLDTAYSVYLKQALQDYSASIQKAHQTITSQSGKDILESSYTSAQTLLSAPQLK